MASAGGHWIKGSFQPATGTEFRLGDTSILLNKAGKVPPEELPPPKEGYLRLYTTLDESTALMSVEENGLLTSYAREREFSGQIIWATGGPEDYSQGRAMVAFDVPEGAAQKVNRTDYTIGTDIPKEDIIATYPMMSWSKHPNDPPQRWDRIMKTVRAYGKNRVLENGDITDEVKDRIRSL